MQNSQSARKFARLSLACCLLYWLALAVLTHFPFPPSEREGPKIDKPLHQIAFALLTLAVCWAVATRWELRWRGLPVLGAAVLAYAVVDEVTQAFVPRRTPALDDWVADLVGVVMGLALWWAIPRAWKAALGDVRTRREWARETSLANEPS